MTSSRLLSGVGVGEFIHMKRRNINNLIVLVHGGGTCTEVGWSTRQLSVTRTDGQLPFNDGGGGQKKPKLFGTPCALVMRCICTKNQLSVSVHLTGGCSSLARRTRGEQVQELFVFFFRVAVSCVNSNQLRLRVCVLLMQKHRNDA